MGSKEDRFALDRARTYAGWVTYGATNITNDIGCLCFWAAKIETQRDFLTEFEAHLDEAEKALTHAIDRVRDARKRYKALPSA
jgi:hypothetical protein